MTDLEKITRERDLLQTRLKLMRMLTELSNDAMKLVWRPITYAYYFTDSHGADTLNDDDLDRLGLIVSAATDPAEVAHEVSLYRAAVHRDHAKRRKST